MAARPAAPAQPLRGRDAEIAAIDAALGGARDGRGSVLLVEGGPGLGKSRLLEEAVRLAGRLWWRRAGNAAEATGPRLVLDPLDEDSVGQVIADLMSAPAGPALLEIADNAHGVPFLLIELLRGLLEEGLVRIDRAQAVLVEARLPSPGGHSLP